jgi:geranylgeranyl reductase family protein
VSARDLVVVGAGPAGAAAAAHAARAGLDVLVLERAIFPRHKPCAEYLSPEAGRDLDELGVLDEVLDAGAARLTGFRLVAQDGSSALGRFAGAGRFAPFRPWGLALPRATLDQIVIRAAQRAGAEVRFGVTVEGPLLGDGGVAGVVTRQAGARLRLRARAVVAADGLRSVIARRLGLARWGRPRRLALVAHLEGVKEVADYGEMFAGRGWYAGLASIGSGLVNAALVVPIEEAGAVAADPQSLFVRRLTSVPELARRLADARIARAVMVTGPFARTTRRVAVDGCLLAGDAADFFDPFTGEGIFAALRGGRLAAETLVTAIASGDVSRDALRAYRRARRREFQSKWVLERVAGLGAVRPVLYRRFVRALAKRPGIADLWVGAAGDAVPVRELFTPRHLLALAL